MAEEIVESKEEMKKNMERKKKNEKITTAKQDTKEKITTAKKDTEEKIGEVKTDTKEKITTAKQDTQDIWENVQENLGDLKNEATTRFEQYRQESEREGRNPAEKFLSDLFTGIMEKTEDINQAVSETATPIKLPLTDIIENNSIITIISDIPGLKKENIDVVINQLSVEITVRYAKEQEEPESKFIQKERGYGEVHRTISLPSIIDADKSTANYKNNILTIKLPKKGKDVTKVTIQ
jgi:HSP20 family protein